MPMLSCARSTRACNSAKGSGMPVLSGRSRSQQSVDVVVGTRTFAPRAAYSTASSTLPAYIAISAG